tara:strand:- start:21406 stop:22263 length:858 start_codon:yes stop_codon:yes gene_type:complete
MKKDIHYWSEIIIDLAIEEDLSNQSDVTSDNILLEDVNVKFSIRARQDMILCGSLFVATIFNKIATRYEKNNITFEENFSDGAAVKTGEVIIHGVGNARLIFASERIILNLLQHLSAISTKTNKFIKKIGDSKTKILDTRKTIPGFRHLHKYAIRIGGGYNHRFSLFDAILIKDNHIAAAGGVKNALNNICSKNINIPIEIECDNLQQVRDAVQYDVDIIMLDNMNIEQMRKAKDIIANKVKIEVSGGVNLDAIDKILDLEIDYISVGELTNSIDAVDIGLDIDF